MQDDEISTDAKGKKISERISAEAKNGGHCSGKYSEMSSELLERWGREIKKWKSEAQVVTTNALQRPLRIASLPTENSRYMFTLQFLLPVYSVFDQGMSDRLPQTVQTFKVNANLTIDDLLRAVYCPHRIFEASSEDDFYFFVLNTFFAVGKLSLRRCTQISNWMRKSNLRQNIGLLNRTTKEGYCLNKVEVVGASHDMMLKTVLKPLLTGAVEKQETIPIVVCHNLCSCEHVFNLTDVSYLPNTVLPDDLESKVIFQKRNKRHKCFFCYKNACFKVCGDSLIPEEPVNYCRKHFQLRFYTKDGKLNKENGIHDIKVTQLVI